jgi:hypothetical protein
MILSCARVDERRCSLGGATRIEAEEKSYSQRTKKDFCEAMRGLALPVLRAVVSSLFPLFGKIKVGEKGSPFDASGGESRGLPICKKLRWLSLWWKILKRLIVRHAFSSRGTRTELLTVAHNHALCYTGATKDRCSTQENPCAQDISSNH